MIVQSDRLGVSGSEQVVPSYQDDQKTPLNLSTTAVIKFMLQGQKTLKT